MQEDNIIIEDYEVGYEILEDQPETTIEATIEVIDVDDVETIYVDADDAFSALGEPNEQLRHQLLTGRDTSDQHPIIAITGLREELDDIKSLKTVYSDKKQLADYYEWEDGNILNENRVGYFVSLCEDTRAIKICTDDEIFGIAIDSAAFVGGQDDIARDFKYSLVIYSGVADVRCELDVEVGNCVLPNNYGMAKKTASGYGYKVVAINNKNDVKYATILLNSTMNQIDNLGRNLSTISERMDDAETNISVAINVANEAYNKASSSTVEEEALGKANEALDKADQALSNTENLQQQVQNSAETSVQAQALANSALTSAETIRLEAVETANNALSEVNNLIKDLEPIYTWTDPETGNKGAEYLTTYMKDGLATKTEVYTVEKLTEDNKSSIEKNAEGFQTLVSSVDKYSVGEYSQAYGLTREQAASILKPGYIYIPTDNFDKCCDTHSNVGTHCETFSDDDEVNYFTPGDYYVWGINDQGNADWIEHSTRSVWIGNIPPANSNNQYKYWYIDSSDPADDYEAYALYIWYKPENEDYHWEKVNTLSGNVNNRLTSMIRQTANKIALEVVNAQGGIASHQQWLDENSANIQDVVSWKPDAVSNIATIKQTADAAGVSIAQVVRSVGSNGEVNAASIVTAVNNDTSSITLNANKINLNGAVTANNNVQITTDGKIVAVHADITGKITADEGNIGGWEISEQYLRYIKSSTDGLGSANSVYLCPAGTTNGANIGNSGQKSGWVITVGNKFGVTNSGDLYANSVHLSGTIDWANVNSPGINDISGLSTQLATISDTANTAKSSIDNMNIGGRNLLLNTEGTKTLQNKVENYTISDYGRDMLSDGEEVILSFEAKSDVNTNIDTYPKYLHTDGKYYYSVYKTFSVTTNWAKYTYSVNLSSAKWHLWTIRSNTSVIGGGGSATANVQIRNVKLESGNKATDWTLAPEDVKSSYETYANTKVSTLDTAVTKYLGLGGNTIIGDSYAISPYIGGGYLNIANGNKRVIIDPKNLSNNGYIFQVHNDNKVTLGIDKDGNATFDGVIYALGGEIGGWELQEGYLRSYTNKTNANDGAFYLSSGQYSGSSSNLSNYWIYIYDTNGRIPFSLSKAGEVIFNKISDGAYSFDATHTYQASDTRSAMRIAVGLDEPTEEQSVYLDVDGDGKITSFDAWLINRKSVGLSIPTPETISVSITKEGFAISDSKEKTIFSAGRQGVYIHELETAVATTNDTSSDINVKNNIELLTDDYDTFFDNLTPRRFKYNHGTSGRYHTGFIAQEMVEALEKSNLTTQDFATVVHLDTPLENGAEWALRKEEMVALNTWQIQKLKARVAELEEKIKRLEV